MDLAKELEIAKKSLLTALGEKTEWYFKNMKEWFKMKMTKEEFDIEVRSLMTEEQIHLHNEFILCLFNKVQGLAAATPIRPRRVNNAHCNAQVVHKKGLRLKRKLKSDNANFEPADMWTEVLCETPSLVRDEPIGANRSSAKELILPHRTFVQARLMLAAWENNMDGAEENAAHVIIAATQIFLKNILTAIFTRRKGFAVRDGTFIHNIGEPVPNPWRKNSIDIFKQKSENRSTEILETDGLQVPSIKPTVFNAEQAKAFALACADQTLKSSLPPVSIADLIKTLKTYKNLVSNHAIYATNMERLFTHATYVTWENLEE